MTELLKRGESAGVGEPLTAKRDGLLRGRPVLNGMSLCSKERELAIVARVRAWLRAWIGKYTIIKYLFWY